GSPPARSSPSARSVSPNSRSASARPRDPRTPRSTRWPSGPATNSRTPPRGPASAMETLSTLTIVQKALFLMEMDQFRGVGSAEIANIATHMDERHYEPGELILKEHEVEDRLFIIIEGEVVHLRHGVVIRRATRGMPFGLFGLLGIVDPDPEV